MKIVAISDMHNKLAKLKLPKADVLVIAGDATNMGTMQELIAFNHDLENVKGQYNYILAISGNHDWLHEHDPGLARSLIPNVTHFLHHEMVEIEGITFFGSPYTPEFCDWAFNVPRGAPLKAKWDQIPDGVDVLITHGPPYSVLDDAGEHNKGLGCHALLEAVKRVKPRLHVFGHIHDSYGIKEIGGTTFINASSCDEHYRAVNKPIEIEI